MSAPAGSTASDVPVRPASTVMLLREGVEGLEVFTLRRVAGMAFAGGMTAFPGGGVDVLDADVNVPWSGPDVHWWARQWRVEAEVARGQVVAAARELFEETGVLLASDDAGTPVAGGDGRERERQAVASHRCGMADVLDRLGARLRTDMLVPWARWITPRGGPRRYDTFFFAAALPEDEQAQSVSTEASSGQWERPADVLDAWQRGEIRMMPPTVAMLTDLAASDSVAGVLDQPRSVEPVTPIVVSDDGEVLRVQAAGQEYRTCMTR